MVVTFATLLIISPAPASSCWYDPDANPTYQELGAHYSTGILPTRPGKPKNKAKVEAGVLVAERLILAPLRNPR